jgi:predicted RNA-binding protein Jag
MTQENTNTSAAPVEGAVTGEGEDLRSALIDAGRKLDVDGSMLEHKLDLSHFKNPQSGINMGVDTVKIWAWPKDPAVIEVSESAKAWMTELLERMDFGGNVSVRVDGKTVLLRVDTPKGGHFVGKQGVTLNAVRTLMDASIGAKHPEFEFKVDVADQRRERDEGRGRDRDDDRRGRGRDRDRDDDRRGRGRDRDRDRGRGRDEERPRRSRGRDEERPRRPREGEERPERDDSEEGNKARNRDIERLAHRLAKRVLKSGKDELIRKEMNSYARRIVHMVVAEYEGLATESVGDGAHKQVRILPAGGGQAEADAE